MATVDDQIIGALAFTMNDEEGFIEAVGVRKDWRLQGVATELKHRAVDYLSKAAVPYYWSCVDPQNTNMIRLNRRKFGLQGVVDTAGEYIMFGATIVDEVDPNDPARFPWTR